MFKKHAIIWVILTLGMIVYSAFFDESLIVDQVMSEQRMIKSTMGDSAFERIRERTNATYGFCCNWIASLTHRVFVPQYDDEQGLKEKMNKAHQGFWTTVYVLITRIFIMFEWLFVFWVIFIASFNHGLVKRSISVTNTAWSSPIRYHLGLHYGVALIGMCVNYLVFPWAINPYMAVVILTLISIVLYVISSNIQQKV